MNLYVVVVPEQDNNMVVSSNSSHVHFRTNTLGKAMKSAIAEAMV